MQAGVIGKLGLHTLAAESLACWCDSRLAPLVGQHQHQSMSFDHDLVKVDAP